MNTCLESPKANRNISMNKFLDVTELPGQPVSDEQIQRIHHRYTWAANLSKNHDVLEVACGSGLGLGVLLETARSIRAIDVEESLVELVRKSYGDQVPVEVANAENTGIETASVDTVLIVEAIYYLPNIDRFLDECDRVLRTNGQILIVSANKDLFDFNPSPHVVRYYGVEELGSLLTGRGYEVDFFGYQAIAESPLRQKLLRPVKLMAAKVGLIPKTMKGKLLLRRIVFGKLNILPISISSADYEFRAPESICAEIADTKHKIIYCIARKSKI